MKKLFVIFTLLVIIVPQMIFAQTKIDKAGEVWVEKTLKSLTLREKIGQMIVTGVLGDYKNVNGEKFAEIKKQIVENKVGGFVFYRGDALELAALTNEMQAIAKIPLFMAADFERGLPMQIQKRNEFYAQYGNRGGGKSAGCLSQRANYRRRNASNRHQLALRSGFRCFE